MMHVIKSKPIAWNFGLLPMRRKYFYHEAIPVCDTPKQMSFVGHQDILDTP